MRSGLGLSGSGRLHDLFVDIEGPHEAIVGKEVPFVITLTNYGDGIVKAVTLQPVLKGGVAMPVEEDSQLFEAFNVKGNEKKELKFNLLPTQTGEFDVKFLIQAANTDNRVIQSTLTARTPRPSVHVISPATHEVGKNARYSVIVENYTSSSITNAVVDVELPDFIQVKTVNREGDYIRAADRHMHLSWQFDSIEANSRKVVRMEASALAAARSTCGIVIQADGRVLQKKTYVAETVIGSNPNQPQEIQNKTKTVASINDGDRN